MLFLYINLYKFFKNEKITTLNFQNGAEGHGRIGRECKAECKSDRNCAVKSMG